jgi:hypothetical protein
MFIHLFRDATTIRTTTTSPPYRTGPPDMLVTRHLSRNRLQAHKATTHRKQFISIMNAERQGVHGYMASRGHLLPSCNTEHKHTTMIALPTSSVEDPRPQHVMYKAAAGNKMARSRGGRQHSFEWAELRWRDTAQAHSSNERYAAIKDRRFRNKPHL